MRGADIKPRPMATICCSPPDNVPHSWLRRSFSFGNSWNTRSRFWPRRLRARGVDTPTNRVSSTVIRSEEHTSELQSLMRISYAVFCLKKKNKLKRHKHNNNITPKQHKAHK